MQIVNEKNFVMVSLVLLICVAISYAVHFDCTDVLQDNSNDVSQYTYCPSLDNNIVVSVLGAIAALVYFIDGIIWIIFTLILSVRHIRSCCKVQPAKEESVVVSTKKQVKKKSVKRK